MKILNKDLKSIIEVQKDVLNGAPCFKGTRVPVSVILEYLALGWSINDLKESYPTVKPEYIEKLIRTYAKEFDRHAQTA
ncbi:MAG TPA: DUF433 domain-containing protein [Candidatus Acidoferrales bacterium]|nr:DUF433 domain-containing protein [Candidatus Acidoferrales bacterium]